MSVPLTAHEQEWLKQFEANLIDSRNAIPDLVIPPRIRIMLEHRLQLDEQTRKWQAVFAQQMGLPI